MPIRIRNTPSTKSFGKWNMSAGSTSVKDEGEYTIINQCKDDVLVGDCGLLEIDQIKEEQICRMEGTRKVGSWIVNCSGYIPKGYRVMGTRPHLDIVRPSNEVLATQMASRTSPSRAVIDLPTFIGELKDLPRLFQVQGSSIIKKAAGANLNVQFGWLPLIADLKDALNIVQAVHNRTRELEKFYRSGLRRTVDLGNYSANATVANQVLCSQTYTDATCNLLIVTQEKVWGHIRWKPTTLPPKGDDAMVKLALRAVLGLSVSSAAVTAWELMPWSWLIDYFSTAGDFLKAHRNTVPAVIDKCVIMSKTETTFATQNIQTQQGFTCSEGRVVKTRKTRYPAYPTLQAYLPYLSGRQVSILGSIIATRKSVRV